MGTSGRILLCLMLSACGHALRSHQVERGDTLSALGIRYGVPYQEIAALNNLTDPNKITVGQLLRMPPGARDTPLPKTLRPMRQARPRSVGRTYSSQSRRGREQRIAIALPPRPRELPPLLSVNGSSRFIWPVAGSLTSRFGPRNNSFHDGIDIAAPRGTPVLAAAAGRVLYNGTLPGYGAVVIVSHAQAFATVYAHLHKSLVQEGQFLKAGQRLGQVGTSGRTSGPNLHFEIRKDNLARNPMPYLPPDRRRASLGPRR